MAVTSTLTGTKILSGVTQIIFTPFEEDVKGEQSWSLDNIVADTTSITQEDPTTNTVDCETRDEPIMESIVLGRYTFSAESADIQEPILVNLFGFTKGPSGSLYAPAVYKEIWAEVELVFGEKGSLVLPKLKVSGNIDASSLKTGVVRGVISGSGYSTEVINGTDSKVVTSFYYKAPSQV